MKTENINRIVIRAFAIIEILTGLTILLSFLIASVTTSPGRPKTVYGFVFITSLLSIAIGIALFKHNRWGRKALVFFAGYVVISKVLLGVHLVTFIGNTVEFVPTGVKDILSLIYHSSVLVVFNLRSIRGELE